MDWLLRTVQPLKPTQADIYSTVLEKILPQEHVKLATFVEAVTHNNISSSNAQRHSFILAIICNVDFEFEQAAILLLSTANQQTSVLAVLPIVSGLNISISETSRSDLQPAHPTPFEDNLTVDAVNPTVLQCKFSVSGDQLIEVSSVDRQALKDATSEVRRLTAIATDHQIWNLDLLGSWIDRYISRKKPQIINRAQDSIANQVLSAHDRLSKLLTSSPPSTAFPSDTTTNSPQPRNKPPSFTSDLPEWRLNWLNERLRELEDDYVTTQKIKVRIGTWNVAGKQPVESLQDWIVPNDQLHKSDLYIICLQEIDNSSEAFVRYTPFRENFWCEVVHKSIESTGTQKVIKVASQQLVGLLIIVFVDANMAQAISDVNTTYLGTGTLGLGNKGATAVRLKFWDTYLTLVNSHLPAFQEQVEARNRDYLEICRRLVFPSSNNQPSLTPSIPKLSFLGGGPNAPSPHVDLFQTGHLIWAGDFNYRLNTTYAEAKSLAESAATGSCSTLLEYDQLKQQIDLRNAFQDFQEGEITFPPTYKFDVGTDNYDTSEKQRIPSYTDRILYLAGRVNDIEVLEYKSYQSFCLSDHKPVASTMSVQVYNILKNKRDSLQFELLRELDGLENDALPDLKVEPDNLQLNFSSGEEVGGALVGTTIFLTNIKRFKVSWQMIPKPGETNVCEDWLKISQLSGSIARGVSEQIHFAIDPIGVNQFRTATRSDEVAEVVILSIEGGRDIFIPITVKFQPASTQN
ncbi:hypothetical protein O181_011278 [Austropuccinia psidii MF-1]|uniref:Inositol polyphosphate-related phosphatase domain-containing protein n=1 Tax=Austropuccinia psidii MF-1 TaxID=1389203 RepID=A0A9Q3GL53_9BASI|nr:hypothetical protein [Austropuccinia psidii MF-1]